MDVGAVVSEYGFPIVAAVGLGYFVYYVWKWVTTEIKKKKKKKKRMTNKTLIGTYGSYTYAAITINRTYCKKLG